MVDESALILEGSAEFIDPADPAPSDDGGAVDAEVDAPPELEDAVLVVSSPGPEHAANTANTPAPSSFFMVYSVK